MITFDSEEFRKRLEETLKYINKEFEYVWEVDLPDILDADFNPDDYMDMDLNENSLVTTSLDRCEDNIELTIRELFELVEEMKTAKLINKHTCITMKRCLVRVNSHDYRTKACIDQFFASDNEMRILDCNINSKKVFVSLVQGFTPYGIMIAKTGEYEKYFPPILPDDIFIQLCFNTLMDQSEIDEIIEAYIFELSTNQGFELFREDRPEYVEHYIEDNELPPIKLRPLMLGKGSKDLLSLFNKSNEVENPEIRILYYTKVIEYVAQTVIRQEKNNAILTRLNSPKVLNPDVNFVLELEALFEEQKIFMKDREAIKFTVKHCCDVVELQKVCPPYLKRMTKIKLETKPADKELALSELATTIIDTRNRIAHAKSNYQPTGNECPVGDMYEFAICLNLVAQQVIRWFGRQHENNRVI